MYRFDSGVPGSTYSITGSKNGKDFRAVVRNGGFMNINVNSLPDNAVLVITKQNYIPVIIEGKENIKAMN